jgi:hypothetical protein
LKPIISNTNKDDKARLLIYIFSDPTNFHNTNNNRSPPLPAAKKLIIDLSGVTTPNKRAE